MAPSPAFIPVVKVGPIIDLTDGVIKLNASTGAGIEDRTACSRLKPTIGPKHPPIHPPISLL